MWQSLWRTLFEKYLTNKNNLNKIFWFRVNPTEFLEVIIWKIFEKVWIWFTVSTTQSLEMRSLFKEYFTNMKKRKIGFGANPYLMAACNYFTFIILWDLRKLISVFLLQTFSFNLTCCLPFLCDSLWNITVSEWKLFQFCSVHCKQDFS